VRGKRRSEAESRESGGIRALISVLGPSKGDEKGGANSRDINSVLAPGGLQRRKLRAEGEYYPSPSQPALSRRRSLSPPLPSLPASPPVLRRVSPERPPSRARREWGGVTNQRLAIVNSTCAVKQLINKRLFTSRIRGVHARAFPPRDDECEADNGNRSLDQPEDRSKLKQKKR